MNDLWCNVGNYLILDSTHPSNIFLYVGTDVKLNPHSANCISAIICSTMRHLLQYLQIIHCRPTSVSAESSCSLSSLAYESQMFLMLRKPCRPQGRPTVTSKSVTSFTQPSISIPSFTFWKIQQQQKNTHKIKILC